MAVNLHFAWKKLTCPPRDSLPASPGTELPHGLEKTLRRSHASKAPVEWAIACVSRKGSALPANIRGHLAALEGEPSLLHFTGKTWRGHIHASLDVSDATFEFTEGFLTHKLEAVMGGGSSRQAFLFDQQNLPAAAKLAGDLGRQNPPGGTI